MANVTIHLEREAEQSLIEKANMDGQTLEVYLQQIVESHIQSRVARNDGSLETNEEQLADRPWRGVFVPVRPRRALFDLDVSPSPDQLPKRPPRPNMNWHRTGGEDE